MNEQRYAVICDHPFYPEIEYFHTLMEAERRMMELIRLMDKPDGYFKCQISIGCLLGDYIADLKSNY